MLCRQAFVTSLFYILFENSAMDRIVLSQARRQGGCDGCECTPSPQAEKARLERSKADELTNAKDESIFSSNLSTHAALHSVENLPDVVDHLKLCS